jgi:RNA polymerase sigma factor (sigma-70 family)
VLRDTPPLDVKDELERAQELFKSRRAFARCVQRLPVEARESVLNGDPRGPERGHKWPLEYLEACCQRLSRYENGDGDARVHELVAEAKHHKRRLDGARDALIMGSLRFVPHVAKNFSHPGISFMDLVQEGNVGLLRAVDRFDPRRGFRFSTYAYWWIRQAISKAVAEKSRVVRFPEHALALLRKLRRTTNELREKLGRYPTSEEIGKSMEICPKRVEELIATMLNPFPLESHDSTFEEPELLMNLADSGAASPLEATLDREARQAVADALDRLPGRERTIVRLRFGLDGNEGLTLEEIGAVVNLSRERVRQVLNDALRRIQEDRGRGVATERRESQMASRSVGTDSLDDVWGEVYVGEHRSRLRCRRPAPQKVTVN